MVADAVRGVCGWTVHVCRASHSDAMDLTSTRQSSSELATRSASRQAEAVRRLWTFGLRSSPEGAVESCEASLELSDALLEPPVVVRQSLDPSLHRRTRRVGHCSDRCRRSRLRLPGSDRCEGLGTAVEPLAGDAAGPGNGGRSDRDATKGDGRRSGSRRCLSHSASAVGAVSVSLMISPWTSTRRC
jgi:hypothetical protein